MFIVNKCPVEWIRKYPDLRIIEGTCMICGGPMPTTIPFVDKGYVGLKSRECCPENKHISSVVIPLSKKEKEYWSNFLLK